MKPEKHKQKILKLITQLREQICLLYEHRHVKYPAKTLNEVEIDVHELSQEIERLNLVERTK